jgi:hypothetical protein
LALVSMKVLENAFSQEISGSWIWRFFPRRMPSRVALLQALLFFLIEVHTSVAQTARGWSPLWAIMRHPYHPYLPIKGWPHNGFHRPKDPYRLGVRGLTLDPILGV